MSSQQKSTIRTLLEQDRAWSAYALADLDPGFIEDTDWYLNRYAVFMTYSGIEPPVLFSHGEADSLRPLVSEIPPGEYQVSIRQEHFEILKPRLVLAEPIPMQRMVLNRTQFHSDIDSAAPTPLSSNELPDIMELFDQQTDQPDAFVPAQLAQGTFHGIYENGKMISFGGTHVVSRIAGIAAVGSIFTHPSHRGKGLATKATAAVVRKLLEWDIQTIVLNVSPENKPAVRCYERLGFNPVYSYYEGAGTIT